MRDDPRATPGLSSGHAGSGDTYHRGDGNLGGSKSLAHQITPRAIGAVGATIEHIEWIADACQRDSTFQE